MASDNKISMPGAFGGLVRYDEEYESRFKVTATHVIGFVVVIIIFVILLKILFPVA